MVEDLASQKASALSQFVWKEPCQLGNRRDEVEREEMYGEKIKSEKTAS
jgi:hypothetical protein